MELPADAEAEAEIVVVGNKHVTMFEPLAETAGRVVSMDTVTEAVDRHPLDWVTATV